MGQHAIKQRKAAARAKKQTVQSSESSATPNNPPTPVTTRVTPQSAAKGSDGDNTTAPEVAEKPKRGRPRKKPEAAPTTRPRSTSATKSGSSIQKVSRARPAPMIPQATTDTEDGDEASQATRPVRKASTAVRTLLHQIALNDITELSESEGSGTEHAMDFEGSDEELEYEEVEDEIGDEDEAEMVAIARPRMTQANRTKGPGIRRKVITDAVTDNVESEGESEEDGES